MQLFVMDDDGANVECIGHLNLGMALHPMVLKDGRVMFSSLESQGLRTSTLWGLWSIHPDGTNWGPIFSAFLPGESPMPFTFRPRSPTGRSWPRSTTTRRTAASAVSSSCRRPAAGGPPFGPGYASDPRNPPMRGGHVDDGRPRTAGCPFSPGGIEALTRFARDR